MSVTATKNHSASIKSGTLLSSVNSNISMCVIKSANESQPSLSVTYAQVSDSV